MPRRSTVERIFTAEQSAVASPGAVIVAPSTGVIIDPRSVVLAADTGNVAAELQSNGITFLHLNVLAGTTEQILLPDGLELPQGSGVELSLDATADVTLYYCLHDENPGVTKVASRLASLNPQVTRAPNQFGDDAKT